jgi:dipeptidyl aminopeptidase/acylaminoacyl peptidase
VGGVEVAGISDFVAFLRDTELGRRAHRRAEYGDERDPFTRSFLERISPLRAVARIVDPVLAIHGRNDPRVPWQASERLVRALRARGGEAWLLVAADEGHGFRKPDNVAAQDAATVTFLRRVFAVSGAAATPR